jgi:steroid 5-alpha reductase family enzyme
VSLALGLLTWIASLARRDASLADRVWPWLIAGPGLAFAWLRPDPLDLRATLVLALLLAWALRLSLYLSWRNWGHGEDRRYRAMREARGPAFAWQSLYVVFGLQALIAWVVSAPLLGLFTGGGAWGAWDLAGLALAGFGIAFSALADLQLARFLNRPRAAGAVMDQGLWRWSRHPNYFGEACLWWGLWLLALGAQGWHGAWSVVSPLLMTWLLLKVSGVTLLEQDMATRRPAYADYVRRTSAFVPWPPREPGPASLAGPHA